MHFPLSERSLPCGCAQPCAGSCSPCAALPQQQEQGTGGGNFPEITPLFNNAVYLILSKRLLCFGALSWSLTILSKMFNLEYNFGESASDLSHRGYNNASSLTFSLYWERTAVTAAQKLEDNTWCGKVLSWGRTTQHNVCTNSLFNLCCIHI